MKYNKNLYENAAPIRCSTCHGYGHLFYEHDEDGVECHECKGTGVDFSQHNQEDKKFILNVVELFTSEKDWRDDREYVIDTLEMNPALRIIDVHDDPDTFIITFRSHAMLIEDGRLSKFF